MKATDLFNKCCSCLKPPERLTLSEWYERNVVFSSAASSKPGKWNRSYSPIQQGIMDAVSDSKIEKIVVMKSGQSGLTTTLLTGAMLYHIYHEPTHVLYVRPSSLDVEKFSKKEFKNLIDGSPNLRGFFKENKGKESSNTIRLKQFPGGSLLMTGSESAGALAGFAARIILIDELDKMKPIPGVGNVIDLAETRSKTFNGLGRKLIYISTPELAGMKNTVEDLYNNQSDMRKYFVPCPKCGEKQILLFENVKYGHCKETLDDIHYLFPCCEHKMYEPERMKVVRTGEWQSTNQEHSRASFAGFWFSDLYSPFSSFKTLVRDWLKINNDPLRLKNFVNEALGEAWNEQFDNKISESLLFNRRERFTGKIPYGIGMLTCGVDVQDDRLEYTILGFGKDEEIWVVEHGTIPGSPGLVEVWETLDRVASQTYKHESGALITLDKMCIDSQGHFTDQVYQFCLGKNPKVVPVRGSNQSGSPLIPAKGVPSGPKHIKRYDLGTETIKDIVFSYLNNEIPGQRYIHFNHELTEDYFKQLTGEVPAQKMVGGQRIKYYKQVSKRVEALDCFVYAYAGYKMANFNNVLPKKLELLVYKSDGEQEKAPETQDTGTVGQPTKTIPAPESIAVETITPEIAQPAPKKQPYRIPTINPYNPNPWKY